MPHPTITFESGHKCIDNGVGDYDLICPTIGGKACFLPYMIAVCATANHLCPACMQNIGENVIYRQEGGPVEMPEVEFVEPCDHIIGELRDSVVGESAGTITQGQHDERSAANRAIYALEPFAYCPRCGVKLEER